MKLRFLVAVLSLALAGASTMAFAQGAVTSSISGVVLDAGGGVVPGADVVVKHTGTGVAQTAVTNAEGAFSFPGLAIGTYTVTVSLQGFKTFVVNDVVLTAGAPANVRATLEVGGITEQVVVSSTSEIIQTQSSVVSSTINTNQIVKLPITSRSAMDFVTLLPGVTTVGGNRQSQINGLPQGVINITLDGVNIQDNTLRSTDGFFAIVSPRLDAIEEVTVTTATQEASSGQGAVQIKFTTRSGTNDLTGSGYHYYRSDRLNANTWFNNRNGVDKAKLKQNQYGGRIGGPIVIPGLIDGRNKAFFFVNYEEFRQPSDVTRNRNVLKTSAQQGIFTWTPTGGSPQTVNLLTLAGALGQTSTPDPVIGKILGDIRSAVSSGSLASIDDNLERFSFNVSTTSLRRYPTTRVDYNLNQNHRVSSAFNYQYFTDTPDTLNNFDPAFPGFPISAGQTSERFSLSNTLRSTLRPNLVNEALVAWSGAPVKFFTEISPGVYSGSATADQVGFKIRFPGTNGMNPTSANPPNNFNPQSRNASSFVIEDTLTALRGRHSLSMGVSWTRYDLWLKNQQVVPNIDLGILNGDPAQAMFNATNFPGASAAQLAAAQSLYAILTGRVTNVLGNAALSETTNEYEYLGNSIQRARMQEAGLFLQDSWRLRPDLTINAGLRYDVQFPFTPQNNSYSTATLSSFCGVSGTNPSTTCNLFQPGVMPGPRPEFIAFGKGTSAYDTDYDNIAPSAGFAWTMKGTGGIGGALFGRNDGDSVVRGGFTRAYSREGMAQFSNRFGGNPGVTIPVDRTLNRGNLGALPLLFRDGARLDPPSFALAPQYPLIEDITQDVNIMDPNLQVPYADTWTVGLQRAVGGNMAAEVRYVGTRSRDTWANLNFNEININENGFLDEFRKAQANLQANVGAGLAAQGFRYRGPGTGTVPLPIMMAYFVGAADPNNPADYLRSTNFATNNTFLTALAKFNPNPFTFANNLYNVAGQRTNAANAGLPANFFLANPDLLGGLNMTTNVGRSNYHALQLELRRRYAQGLQFNASYALGNKQESVFRTFRRDQFMARDAGDPGDISHVFKFNAVYDLPFGQGRRFGGNVNGAIDRIIGGWSLSLVSRVQSGRLVEFGNVRLVGMTPADVQGMFKLRFDDTGKKVWMLPQDVIDETIKAFSVNATSATGYGAGGAPTGRYFAPANGPDCIEPDNGAGFGECGGRSLVITGPMYQQHDITVAKRVNLFGRSNVEFRLEMLNAFNHHNFLPVAGLGSTLSNYEVTGLTGTNTARVIQLVSRINW